jgi:predicted amidophosphoribosyltransferase
MMAIDLDRVGGLRGSRVVLVDDIVTTGATLVEAARALQAVGLEARAAVVAATPRRPVVAQRFPD